MRLATAIVGMLLFLSARAAAAGPDDWSIARVWNEQALNCIRLTEARPPVNARTLYQLSVAMYDAWAAYDEVATPVFARERATASSVHAARREAISFACYRVLRSRFARVEPPMGGRVREALDSRMRLLGYDISNTSESGREPAAVGNRVAAEVLRRAAHDGAREDEFYATAPNGSQNSPLVISRRGVAEVRDINRWQPIAFDFHVTQGGLLIGAAIQTFACPHWGNVTPFALAPSARAPHGPWLDPGPPPAIGGPRHSEAVAAHVEILRLSSWLDSTDEVMVDVGPVTGLHSWIEHEGAEGVAVNPITSRPYEPAMANRADFGRVVAEFWADGPHSETPPGHWNTIANEFVSDSPFLVRKLGGAGRELDPLEWDVKLYLALNGAMHDAAVAAWSIKAAYSGNRPLTVIRWMAERGQSSDPRKPRFDPLGLPLIPGLIEQITEEDLAAGGRFKHLRTLAENAITGETEVEDPVGEIAVRAWRGHPDNRHTQAGGVGWILGTQWLPYQRREVITPPFPGYVSGHSCISRAAAEVLSWYTGSEFFPGGIAAVHITIGTLPAEYGPTADVPLIWARFTDASNQAALSRRFGGIHSAYDDFPAREIGKRVAESAIQRALTLFGSGT